MNRLFMLLLLFTVASISGCGRSDSSNIMDAADQKAIDDYDAQVEKNDAALGNYKDIK